MSENTKAPAELLDEFSIKQLPDGAGYEVTVNRYGWTNTGTLPTFEMAHAAAIARWNRLYQQMIAGEL